MWKKGISKSTRGTGRVARALSSLLLVASILVASGLATGVGAEKQPVSLQTPRAAAAPTTANISLVAGQNLISLPLIPVDPTINTVLAGIVANVNSVWYYDVPTASWQSWSPLVGGDLAAMVDGYGYWINMSAPATLTITGYVLPDPPAVPPAYPMYTGWNLVGFKSTTAKQIGTYLTGTDFRFPVYGYSSSSYTTLTAATDMLQPGAGYWVYFNANGVVTP